MSERKLIFSREVGGDIFDIFRNTYQRTFRHAGVARVATVQRDEYRINGMRATQRDWQKRIRAGGDDGNT